MPDAASKSRCCGNALRAYSLALGNIGFAAGAIDSGATREGVLLIGTTLFGFSVPLWRPLFKVVVEKGMALQAAKPKRVPATQAKSQKTGPPRLNGEGVIYYEGPSPMDPGNFQADQCVPNAVVDKLRSHGLNVITTKEAGLQDADDVRQIDTSTQTRRVLITHDKGFMRKHEQGWPHAGIVLARPGKVWHQEILRVCLAISAGAKV